MDFLYLFGLVNFDEDGKVSGGSGDINLARSNYLYLLSKYNQTILQEKGSSVPDFFKFGLQDVLNDVQNGGDFEKAAGKVLSNCDLTVQALAGSSKSERDLICKLNGAVSARDEIFANLVGKNVNHLQLAYIINKISGKVEQKIENSLKAGLSTTNEKSRAYKDMIKYNRLMLTAQKVGSRELSVKDLTPVVA